MSDCDRIEAAMSGLNVNSKLADAAPLAQVMQEINGSHIVGTKLMQGAPAVAQELEAAHKYTKVFNPDLPTPGAEALIQQQHGIANTIVLTEGPRSETLRIEADNPVPTPEISNTTYMCHDKPVTAWSIYFDGKPALAGIHLPELSIQLDRNGRPEKIEPE